MVDKAFLLSKNLELLDGSLSVFPDNFSLYK